MLLIVSPLAVFWICTLWGDLRGAADTSAMAAIHRALRFTRKDRDSVSYDEIFSLQWMTFFWLALFLVIFPPNSPSFCRAYPPSTFPFFSFSSALLSAPLSFFSLLFFNDPWFCETLTLSLLAALLP